jgi:hypothetical protein
MPLALLHAEAVAAYLAARFPQQQLPAGLALWLHQRTDGQPLFLVTLVQALVERGVLYEHEGYWTAQEGLDTLILAVPESLRQLLEQQITRLPSEAQRVYVSASVSPRSCRRYCWDNSSGVSPRQSGRQRMSWGSACTPSPSSRPTRSSSCLHTRHSESAASFLGR